MHSNDAFLTLLFDEQIYVHFPKNEDDQAQDIEGVHFYGENKLNTLVLVDMQTPDLLKAPEYKLLLKIMGAVNHTPNEFALVNIQENENLVWPELEKHFEPKNIIVFGISIAESLIPTATALYQISQSETSNFLLSDPLRFIMTDTAKKKQLWVALKKMFEL